MAYVNWKKLKARVPITAVLDHYDLLETMEETTAGLKGLCPICASHAFKVNTEKNIWFCFGECQSESKDAGKDAQEKDGKEKKNGGNILDLVARLEEPAATTVSVENLKRAATLINDWFPQDGENAVRKNQNGNKQDAVVKTVDKARRPTEAVPKTEEGTVIAFSKPAPAGPRAEPTSGSTENRPLPFTLKGVDPHHSSVQDAQIKEEIAAEYGVGYFSGKGSMQGRIVFPFYDDEGETLAYVGYSPKDGSWKYPPPEKFNPSLELYGLFHAQTHVSIPGEAAEVVLCRTPLAALHFNSWHQRVVPIAVTTPTLSARQRKLLETVLKPGDKLLMVAPTGDPDLPQILDLLLPLYHVRLARS